mmetsp:Transcript_4110/g.8964  ORF Transcript_4110/g.8964 Transcript_4110/m.8964 type:complete len:240 (+) Transcript_4110:101-820(+)|eukprot:CAMPEP_0202897194 /NCGR_PEP_ID=MMETSP1392-20130828/6021_1 /ASSEMBLY_ACC=CAM_ASM_000868 /TAXON_ID=225041 /ORGANISM="Chlamydomonas chlamydogama, Strain SAG 11-48b" /LENGTH=239 /DNA_ID=CAMNT_0049582773 /DNA_START=78 /DNA_END=797 /DNA_ORIENTATION=-
MFLKKVSAAPSCNTARSTAAVRLPERASRLTVRALDDSNIAVSLLASATASTVVAGVTLATAANRDKELERLQSFDIGVVGPLAAGVVGDAVAHSIPGLNVLLGLVSEPTGAAVGVAYLMSLLLAAEAIDPNTLAPKGTVLDVKTAKDISAGVRQPFTRIIPTTLSVIDWENEGSSGKGWSSADGLPRLPINSVLIVLGVGSLIVEALSHAPVLSAFMPRVLSVAAWYALAGWALDKRQ